MWVKQNSGTSNVLYGACSAGSNNQYAVGASGTILHAVSGPTSVEENNTTNQRHVLQSFPNPTATTTTLRYIVSESSPTVIDIIDAVGNTVSTVVDEHLPLGPFERVLDTRALSNGVYFYRLRNGRVNEVSPFTVVR
jgi:hypothetical protein